MKDFTGNKMASHLRLQSELSTNPKFVHLFSKGDNLVMCAPYCLTVLKNKKKAEVAELLGEKILSCSGMSCAEVFRNNASQHQPPTSQDQPSISHDQLTSQGHPRSHKELMEKPSKINRGTKPKGKGKGKKSQRTHRMPLWYVRQRMC